jgi:flagellar hook-associated protein 3 FlgL
LSLEDSVLSGIGELLQRVREIAVQLGSGSLSKQDRGFLAEEVNVRQEELLGLLNTKDSNGEFIFAGYRGSTQPFVDSGGGGFKYQGDEGERLVQIGATTFVASRDSGKPLFEEIPSDARNFVTSINPRNTAVPPASITVGSVIDQEAYDQFFPEDAYIEFEPAGAIEPPGLNYTVRRASDNRVIEGLQNERFVSGNQINFQGISMRITGTPDPGDSFIIESSSQQGVLTTLSRMVDGFRRFEDTPEGRAQVASLVDSSINNLDNAQTSILEGQSKVGARLNTLQSTQSLHEQVDLVSQDVLSQLQDVDFAEAVSRLSLETFVLEAAQQSFARIANLSLFNSL